MPKLTSRPLSRRLFGTLAAVLMTANAPALADEQPTVVAVNYALSYFAERLGGDEIDVIFPVPDGVDPSFWRPGIADISTMQSADLIVLNGAGFATWITKASLPRSRLLDTSRGFEDRFIATETITHSHGADGEHSHTGKASFTWLDQEQAIMQASTIAEALAQRGLVEPDEIETRLSALTENLLALDAAAEQLRPLAEGKVLIATHPRYQYFSRAYGLEIRSLEWEAGRRPMPTNSRSSKRSSMRQVLRFCCGKPSRQKRHAPFSGPSESPPQAKRLPPLRQPPPALQPYRFAPT